MTESDIQTIINYEFGAFVLGFCFGYLIAIFKSLAALTVNFK
jgi:hypothetical protein